MLSTVLNIVILIVSIYALVEGSNLFVDQSSAIARKYHIPEFLIGITIVALGTSMPEFAISFAAALKGNVEITATNVLGSSIANIGFILAITSLFGAIKIAKKNLTFDIPFSVISVLVFLALIYISGGNITWVYGLIMLVIFIGYLIIVYFKEKNSDSFEKEIKGVKLSIPLLLLGLVLIILGGKYAVDSSIDLANVFGISQGFAGFTILAIGSSLPELMVSVIALKKKAYGLSLGNIIGSNFFNLFFIVGICSLILPLSLKEYVPELLVLLGYNLALIVTAFIGKKYYISKREGIFLFISYLVLIVYLFYR